MWPDWDRGLIIKDVIKPPNIGDRVEIIDFTVFLPQDMVKFSRVENIFIKEIILL